MNKETKIFDLQPRTLRFAKETRSFIKGLPKTIDNIEDSRQLVRASGSVGANYIEANESLGKKDFAMHMRICRKEAKESQYWLQLVDVGAKGELEGVRQRLIVEAGEFIRIFSAIIRNVTCSKVQESNNMLLKNQT